MFPTMNDQPKMRSARQTGIVSRVSDLIGWTPLFELLRRPDGARLLLKLEGYNPTGSAKIRMARQMLDEALEQGLLSCDGHVIESTSGNTGMALALLAAERGLRFTAVVDHHASPDKLRVMKAFGAHLHFVADGDELATVDREAFAERFAAEEPDRFWTEQHNNPANAHGYRDLALELDEVIGQPIHTLVGAVGTGGSLFGTASALKSLYVQNSSQHQFQVIGVEPVGSIAFGGPGGPYYQSGTGTPPGAIIGSAVDYSLLDEGVKISDAAAFTTVRYLARKRSLLIGGSGGGVVCHALRMFDQLPAGATLVALICDSGEKYLDSIYDDAWLESRNLFDPSIIKELETYFRNNYDLPTSIPA